MQLTADLRYWRAGPRARGLSGGITDRHARAHTPRARCGAPRLTRGAPQSSTDSRPAAAASSTSILASPPCKSESGPDPSIGAAGSTAKGCGQSVRGAGETRPGPSVNIPIGQCRAMMATPAPGLSSSRLDRIDHLALCSESARVASTVIVRALVEAGGQRSADGTPVAPRPRSANLSLLKRRQLRIRHIGAVQVDLFEFLQFGRSPCSPFR